MTQADAATELCWSKHRVSLIETGRIRTSIDDVTLLVELYRVPRQQQPALFDLTQLASRPGDADTLVWVTSHNVRKTTATILDEAGHSARQVADQLRHSKPSMTQDVYVARKVANPAAAEALERALPDPDEN